MKTKKPKMVRFYKFNLLLALKLHFYWGQFYRDIKFWLYQKFTKIPKGVTKITELNICDGKSIENEMLI